MRPTINKATGLVVYLTHHALERWDLRSGGDIEAALQEALPFGAANTVDCIRLAYDNVVFVVAIADDGHRVCKTVLERRHAVSDVEAYHGGHRPQKISRRAALARKRNDKRRRSDD
jgi:hypothetical protein